MLNMMSAVAAVAVGFALAVPSAQAAELLVLGSQGNISGLRDLSAGFERASAKRWRHVESGVDVDLLFAGDPIPPHGRARFPDPDKVGRSDREADVVRIAAPQPFDQALGRCF